MENLECLAEVIQRHNTKICVKEMKEKFVTFTKGWSKFLVNKQGKATFSVENFGLFFQGSGKVKQEIITRNWTYELPHKFPNNLGFIVLENEEILRLFNWLLNSSINND